jgi:hypothetical protein
MKRRFALLWALAVDRYATPTVATVTVDCTLWANRIDA